MAKLPSTILSMCAKSAHEYTLSLMDNPTYESARFVASTGSCIAPYQDVIATFFECGYGPKKAEKWINEWNDMGLIKWYFYNQHEKYMAFLKSPITAVQNEHFTDYLLKEKKKKDEYAKTLGF